MNIVAVVIPIYKTEFSAWEMRSLQQAYSLLHAYPLIIIKPQSLDLSLLQQSFPDLRFESFDDDYFKGISGYNRLMLAPLFYERFFSYEYILIYQLDAYVFKDELVYWCTKGYDYIGAPWLKKKIYNSPVISGIMALSRWYAHYKGKPSKQDLYNKIGNGGLSLRKVKSHYKASLKYRLQIDYYLSQPRCHFYNEDVFWATEVSDFIYPTVDEALLFSFDKYPSYSYRLNKGVLPFGCHSWYKRKMKSFWKPIIGF